MLRLKLFVDFWNFQLNWNDFVGKGADGQNIRIPWKLQFPKAIGDAVGARTGQPVVYAGTHVYASVEPGGDGSLRGFFNAMNSFPGYVVLVKERKARRGIVRCTECKHEITTCPKCQKQLRRTVEKGIDAAIITELIQMGHDNTYDVAVVCSGDADLCAAVHFVQQRLGKKVYNVWFPGFGIDLRNACWDHLVVRDLLKDLGVTLPPPTPPI